MQEPLAGGQGPGVGPSPGAGGVGVLPGPADGPWVPASGAGWRGVL